MRSVNTLNPSVLPFKPSSSSHGRRGMDSPAYPFKHSDDGFAYSGSHILTRGPQSTLDNALSSLLLPHRGTPPPPPSVCSSIELHE